MDKLQQAKDEIAKEYGYNDFTDIPYTILTSQFVRYENYQDIVNKVATRYHELMSEWISVEDSPPEIETTVLVSNSKDKWVVCGFLNKNEIWFNDFDDSNCSIIPTHWQPLPTTKQQNDTDNK